MASIALAAKRPRQENERTRVVFRGLSELIHSRVSRRVWGVEAVITR